VTHGFFGERVDPLPDEIYNVEHGDAVPPPTPLTLTAAAPASGPIEGGTAVILTGTGFLFPGWHITDVTFVGMSATYVVDSDTQLTATTASVGAAGVGEALVARMDTAEEEYEDARIPWEYTAPVEPPP
jgi:hypothetical protein